MPGFCHSEGMTPNTPHLMKTCKTCGETKPFDDFSVTDKARNYRYPHCKPCAAAIKREKRRTDGDEVRAYNREYFASRRQDPEFVERERLANRKSYHKLRRQVIDRLGGECEQCGINAVQLLQIDHRHGGGNQHRGRLPGGHTQSYREMRDLSDDDLLQAYRCLCGNCHVLVSREQQSCRAE